MTEFLPNLKYPIQDQWRAHLQASAHTQDITEAVDRSISAYNECASATQSTIQVAALQTELAIREGSAHAAESTLFAARAQIEVARRNAAQIVGAIEVSRENMLTIGRALDYRLELLHDQAAFNSILLKDIAEMLRIPDFQKERRYYIEQGLKHHHNGLVREALMNLLKAEEREETDYFVLHRIGLIYLFENDDLELNDPVKAEQYFLRAGRYATAESHPNARKLPDPLARGIGGLGGEKHIAAEAYDHAALACYAQGKLGEALAHARTALALFPENEIVAFRHCKMLAANQDGSQAAQSLEPLIRVNRALAGATANDSDLNMSRDVVQLLERLRAEGVEDLQAQVAKIDEIAAPFLYVNGTRHSEMQGLRDALRSAQYEVLRKALDAVPPVIAAAEKWQELMTTLIRLESAMPKELPVAQTLARIRAAMSTEANFNSVQITYAQLCDERDCLVDPMEFVSLAGNVNAGANSAVEAVNSVAETLQQLEDLVGKLSTKNTGKVLIETEKERLLAWKNEAEKNLPPFNISERIATLDYTTQRTLRGWLGRIRTANEAILTEAQPALQRLSKIYRAHITWVRIPIYVLLSIGIMGIAAFLVRTVYVLALR